MTLWIEEESEREREHVEIWEAGAQGEYEAKVTIDKTCLFHWLIVLMFSQ